MTSIARYKIIRGGWVLNLDNRQADPANILLADDRIAEIGPTGMPAPDDAEIIYESGKLAARLVDKILKGVKPADMPVEVNPKIEFAVNLKTAQALGLTIPPEILFQATKVIR